MMKDLSRVKFHNSRAYIPYRIKRGRNAGNIKKNYGKITICRYCNGKCFVDDGQIRRGWGKYCGHSCKIRDLQRKHSYNWKGGRAIDRTHGYIKIYIPSHPYTDHGGYVLEHRLIIEEVIGRYLRSNEEVHHLNENRKDNRRENLILVTKSQHRKLHNFLRRDKVRW